MNSSRGRTNLVLFLLASALGAAVGWHAPRLLRYLQRFAASPEFLLHTQPPPTHYSDLEARALRIATANLTAGVEPRALHTGEIKLVLCAGQRNFREPWARDFGFASLGLMELGEFKVVRETLEAFLLSQRTDGQFPVKLHGTSVLDRYMHSLFNKEQPADLPLRPKYITAHNTISLDGNALLVVAFLRYVQAGNDPEFTRHHWSALVRAFGWLGQHAQPEDALLHQEAFTDWADTVARQGKVLYTNVIYWKALSEMAQVADLLGWKEEASRYETHAQVVRDSIQSHFWREHLGYFVTSQVFDNLSSSGNLLAIAWGLASPEQSHRILDTMRYFAMESPVPTKAVHRAYPSRFIALENRIGGIADYHTYFAWLWLGAWHVIALARLERLEESKDLLYRMSRVIARDGAVHEVYAPNGQYASSLSGTHPKRRSPGARECLCMRCMSISGMPQQQTGQFSRVFLGWVFKKDKKCTLPNFPIPISR